MPATEKLAMPQPTTFTVRAETLPKELTAQMQPRPLPSSRIRVTLEAVEPTREEFINLLRAGIDRGRADVAAGRVVDGEEMFARLRAKHFPEDTK
jgi:hypothetical protein